MRASGSRRHAIMAHLVGEEEVPSCIDRNAEHVMHICGCGGAAVAAISACTADAHVRRDIARVLRDGADDVIKLRVLM